MAENYDREVIDRVRELLANIRGQLKAGADGPGATLTLSADDCVKLLACIVDPPKPPGQPGVGDNVSTHHAAIKRDVSLRERGMPLKAAVKETATLFKCKRSTVYAAYDYAAYVKRHMSSK